MTGVRLRSIPDLTETEVRILALIALGLTNEQITSMLGVARNTLKTHIRHIYRKLGVTERAQAISWVEQARAPLPRTAEHAGSDG
jgi:DNA-binding CsgD family transcriptional regulator